MARSIGWEGVEAESSLRGKSRLDGCVARFLGLDAVVLFKDSVSGGKEGPNPYEWCDASTYLAWEGNDATEPSLSRLDFVGRGRIRAAMPANLLAVGRLERHEGRDGWVSFPWELWANAGRSATYLG